MATIVGALLALVAPEVFKHAVAELGKSSEDKIRLLALVVLISCGIHCVTNITIAAIDASIRGCIKEACDSDDHESIKIESLKMEKVLKNNEPKNGDDDNAAIIIDRLSDHARVNSLLPGRTWLQSPLLSAKRYRHTVEPTPLSSWDAAAKNKARFAPRLPKHCDGSIECHATSPSEHHHQPNSRVSASTDGNEADMCNMELNSSCDLNAEVVDQWSSMTREAGGRFSAMHEKTRVEKQAEVETLWDNF